jgi:putative phosphoribosyl transferase
VVTEIEVPGAGVRLLGDLHVPADARGLVVFAHGSGSSRHSPRNRQVAETLQAAGFGTLLFDLLTAAEERRDARTGELRFDIPLLADRLIGAVDEMARRSEARGLPLGLFGASTGAAAALVAASARPDLVRSVVSRGGRPDLAADALFAVRAPTLLLVGELDEYVLELNRQAARALQVEHEVSVVPDATHLFGEPGALEEVARRSVDWFTRTIPAGTAN